MVTSIVGELDFMILVFSFDYFVFVILGKIYVL